MASALGTAIALVGVVKDASGRIQTEPFLNVARLLLPIIDKLGVTFYPVKQDVSGNIERLGRRAREDAVRYACLFEIVTTEVAAGKHEQSDSCAKGLLWLKRAMEFVLGLLRQLHDDDEKSMSQAANEAYASTLQPFHGMITYGVFTAAMSWLPSREAFFSKLDAGADLKPSMKLFLDCMTPLVQEVHNFLVENDLNDKTPV
ncbi:unnamed protein product [Ostreobium quekettii]|uniref:Glycolipid transfer protein domain-containing protein n=1 Tax=Ostreobium quekettii TaxID=121088 RepID=A0A8S1JFP0_9CHLO|nr:unnamed protein product [Ostreobium quekettii]|eukprot:evm.model.scf_1692.1 EVM.evm.TU.scf_1692.1   scf_1692:4690-6076(+)